MREYLVRRHGSGQRAYWTVKIGREVHGNYLSEWAAMLDAIDAAQIDGEKGKEACVRVTREDGSEAAVWRFGDAYPIETMPASNDNETGDRLTA
jgi:antirestriction protein